MPIMDSYRQRIAAIRYIERFLGQPIPYKWGGDDPIEGFDCSGFILEILQAVGLISHGVDMTAGGLYLRYRENKVEKAHTGCLLFWLNQNGRATHVEMAIDAYYTVGAAGGGSSTLTREDAVRQNAFIRMRPIEYRGTASLVICDPFKEAA